MFPELAILWINLILKTTGKKKNIEDGVLHSHSIKGDNYLDARINNKAGGFY